MLLQYFVHCCSFGLSNYFSHTLQQLVLFFRAYNGYIRHGVTISLWEYGFNTRRYTLVHGFSFFKLFFFISPKELMTMCGFSRFTQEFDVRGTADIVNLYPCNADDHTQMNQCGNLSQ